MSENNLENEDKIILYIEKLSKQNQEEMKSYLDTINERNQKDMKHYLGVLNEAHGETLKQISEMNEITKVQITQVNERLNRVENTLDSHTGMIGTLMTDVSEIKNILEEKVDKSEFVAFKKELAV